MEERNNNESEEKKEILKYCPNCGVEIKWTKNLKFCINCGSYLIPHIDKDEIEEWLGINVSQKEIEELYNKRTIYPSHYRNDEYYQKYYEKKLWDYKASFGVPIAAFIGKLFLILALMIVLFIIGAVNIDNLLNIASDLTFWLTILDLSTQLIFVLIVFLFVGKYVKPDTSNKEKWKLIGIPIGNKRDFSYTKEILIGVIVGFLMYGLVILVQYLSAFLTNLIWDVPLDSLLQDDGMADLLKPPSIFALIILIVLQFVSIAPAEEILFRGFSQPGFNRTWGKNAGIIVTAVYFSFFHIFIYILNPPMFFFLFLPYFAISLVLGLLVEKRGNLYGSIIAHAVYNSIQFILLFYL